MSYKVKSSGRELKNISDPSLAHSHKRGATVHFAQTAVDKKWGRYMFHQYRRCVLILNKGLYYYKRTLKLLDRCRQLEVQSKTGFRHVPDKLRDQLEINTVQFLVLTKLGLEYLVVEYLLPIQRIKKHRGEKFSMTKDSEDLGKSLSVLGKAVGVKSKLPRQTYKIIDQRHIVEHPTKSRLWNGSETGWKTVNLSWVLSGEIEGILDPVMVYVNEFMERAEKYIKDNPIPGELKISHRGLKAGEQYKKPTS